jgi:hypothetical protein
MVEDESKCGGCLDGYDPDVNNEGGCVLAPVDCGEQVWDEIAGECVDPDPGFVEGGPCKTEGGDSGTYDAEGACVADPVEPTPCSNNATIESGCETCENGSLPSAHENGDCSQPLIPTQVTCPDNTPNKGQVVDKLSDCGEPTNPSGYDCTQPKPSGFTFSTVAWNQNCEVTHCTDGTLKDDAEGSNCPGYVAPVAPSNNCGQQDRVERPDGSCGECLPGFIEDPQGFDQCIQAPPECSDCSCAEYALENPEECATETPEPPPETGGGGGGANASGYASPPPDISYQLAGDPQLLDRQRFAGVQQGLFSRPQPTLFGSKARSETLKNFPIAEFLSQSGVFKA